MKNGLLFYNGRFNDRNDFMALEIVDGQLQFSFSTGTNKTSVRSKVKGGVANGEWQFAQVDYINRVRRCNGIGSSNVYGIIVLTLCRSIFLISSEL